jgi:hypothetical protein
MNDGFTDIMPEEPVEEKAEQRTVPSPVKIVGVWLMAFGMIMLMVVGALLGLIHVVVLLKCFVEWDLTTLRSMWHVDGWGTFVRLLIVIGGVIGAWGATSIVSEEM